MLYGICNLSIVPLRHEANDTSEMVSQVLFGEHFKVLEKRKKWSRIRLAHDRYEGWIDNKQYVAISKEAYKELDSTTPQLSADLIELATCESTQNMFPISLGSTLPHLSGERCQIADNYYHYQGSTLSGKLKKEQLATHAYMYLNAPYLWGGRTPFGIDCSGFTQMVYRLNGIKLSRDASQQAQQGTALSFIEEAEPGDLAFFDNSEGRITHVGIILSNNSIIHASGKVRIDRIDQTGIFNVDTHQHSHTLRVIKKII